MASFLIPMRRAEPNGRKTRPKLFSGSLPPGNDLPYVCRQRKRQLFYRNRLVLRVPVQSDWGTPSALPPFLGPRHFTGLPHGHVFVNAHRILQLQFRDPFPKPSLIAIGGVGQNRCRWYPLFYRHPNLRERNRRLGFKTNLFGNTSGLTPFPVAAPTLRQV